MLARQTVITTPVQTPACPVAHLASVPQTSRTGFTLTAEIDLDFTESVYWVGEATATATLALSGGDLEPGGAGDVSIVCVDGPDNKVGPGWSGTINDNPITIPLPMEPGEYTYQAVFNVHTDPDDPDQHDPHATRESNAVTITVVDVSLAPDPVVVTNGQPASLQVMVLPDTSTARNAIEVISSHTAIATVTGTLTDLISTLSVQRGTQSGRTTAIARLRDRPSVECAATDILVTNLALSVSQEYILADAQDTTTVTVQLGDGQGGDVPATDVILHTTGGTFAGGLSTITVQTNQDGEASATLTSSDIPGEVAVSAEEGTSQASVTVTFFTATVSVSPATYVPNTTPAVWGIPLGEAGEYVDLMVRTTPDIPTEVLTPRVTWTNGEAYPIPETDPQEYDPLMRRVSRRTSGMTEVTATVAGNVTTQDVVTQIVVVAVTDLQVETGLTAIDSATAAAAVNATPDTYGVLRATVSPATPNVSAIYSSLLTWTGGDNGSSVDRRRVSLNEPSKQTITAHCGTSSASKEVFIIQVNVALPGVKEEDETDPTKVPDIVINDDDDDDSDESDMVESPVTGEDDLLPLRLYVLPDGLGGEVTLSKGAHTKLYTKDTKEHGESVQLWTLDVGEVVPRQLYVEGTGLSTTAGDQEFTLAYSWGTLTLSDTVKATVVPQKVSSCHLKICKASTLNGQPFPGESSYGAIGGTQMGVAVSFTIGIGERLDPAMVEAELRIRDDLDPEGTYTDLSLGLNDGAGWWHKETNGWVYGGVAPSAANLNGDRALRFIKFIPWNTQTTPSKRYEVDDDDDGVFDREVEFGVSHNGDHSVGLLLDGVFGCQMVFQTQLLGGEWPTEGYESGPQVQTACVKNLVIKNVSSSNGTVDYLKYDIDYDSENNRPSVTFTFEDDGETHQRYRCSLMLQPTSDSGFDFIQSGDVFALSQSIVVSEEDNPKTVTLVWDGSTRQYPIVDTATTSTYAYDVMVEELDEEDNLIDAFSYKWPYCLTAGEHDVWLDDKKIMFKYRLHDNAFGSGTFQDNSNHQESDEIEIKAFNEYLEEYPIEEFITDTGAINVLHNGIGEGIVAYSYTDYLGGPWRVVITGVDHCWKDYRRDRENSRMLAANSDVTVEAAKEWLQFQNYDIDGNCDNDREALWYHLELCRQIPTHANGSHPRIAIILPGFGAANDPEVYKQLAKNLYKCNKGRREYDRVIFLRFPTCTWTDRPALQARPFRFRTDQIAEAVALKIDKDLLLTDHTSLKLDFFTPCYGGLIIEMAIMEFGLRGNTNNFVTISSPLNGIPYCKRPVKGQHLDEEQRTYQWIKALRRGSDEEILSMMNSELNNANVPNTNKRFKMMNEDISPLPINIIKIGGDQPLLYITQLIPFINRTFDRLYGGEDMYDGMIGWVSATTFRNARRTYSTVKHYNHDYITTKQQDIRDIIDIQLKKWDNQYQ